MPWRALAFALGVWAVQQLAVLPAPTFFALAGGVGIFLFLMRQPWPALLAALLLGWAWAGGWAHYRLAEALPTVWEGRDVEVVGMVSGLPQRFERGVRFVFEIESAAAPLPRRLALAWYRQIDTADEEGDQEAAPAALPLPRGGERWRLTVRLKQPHGSLNPQGFDVEGWWFERGIRATGYVRKADNHERLGMAAGLGAQLDRWREAARTRLLHTLGDAAYGGIVVALAIGDQQAIAPELWRLFAATGITHLMSISGLHVTMLGALVGWAVFALWRRSPRLPLCWPSQKAAALAGLLGAFAYALLAGFGIPAQRTLFMLAVVVAALLSGRALSAGQVLGSALVGVLLLDPWAVLSAGFWLSFAAVAWLFWIAAAGPRRHWLHEWLRAQWAITLGLMPLLLALFQQFSLVSLPANALAIPLVSLAVTPLALLGLLPGCGWALELAHALLVPLLAGLQWLAQLPGALWQQHAPPAWAVLLALVGAGVLLWPKPLPWRWVASLLWLPLFAVMPPRPAPGAAVLTVLDVGQGQAVHVQTATHDLLYDTGPDYGGSGGSGGGSDAGSRVIVPYLRAAGVRRLDAFIVSHADRDHAGGLDSVLAGVPVTRLLTSFGIPVLVDEAAATEKSALAGRHEGCADGQGWEWDGVRFRLLHPAPADYEGKRSTNAMSCVLKIEAAGGSALLPGDIEGPAEAALLARHGTALATPLLVAPHHGGRRTSSADFVAAVGARVVVFPVGYRNRFGHPAAAVLERYAASGATILRTDRDGAVRVALRVGAASGPVADTERTGRARYWHHRFPG